MKYILGLIGVIIGLLMVIKTESIIQTFGTSAWAEEKMGLSGGTRFFYKLIGIGIIFISFLGITGMLNGFLIGTIGRIFTAGV